MKRNKIKSAYMHLIEVVLYFFFVGFLFGGIALILFLAPVLLLATITWIVVVLCMWPILLPIMIALKHTHVVRKTWNFAIKHKNVRKLILYTYNKFCTM